MKLILLGAIVILITLTLGCGDSGTDSVETYISDNAARLLGLQEDFICEYIRYDTVVTYPPLDISVDTMLFSFTGIATDPARVRFDLWFDSIKSTALKTTANSIVNLGYYRVIDDHDSLFMFAEPPQLYPTAIREGETWESTTPPYYQDSESITATRLYLSWGFEVTRKFDRRESLLLPLGTYKCYVFMSEYRLPGEEDVIETAYEFFADGVGLVKCYSYGPFGASHIFMISREIPEVHTVR